LTVRAATREDIAAIRALLIAAQLPVEDLDTAPNLRFWVAEDGDLLAGAIGLEPRGTAGLLRSLVVAPAYRQNGLGSALVAALERDAQNNAVVELVLLTQTATAFFERRGFVIVDRANVADEIKHSAEFRSLCPASADCMTKLLAPSRVALSNA
jgi:N-acetylglutamate synthase-like GNAT family acetyltransferase